MKESTSDCQHAIVRIDGETSYRVIFNSVNAPKDTASEKGVGLNPEIVGFKRSLGMDIEASQDANRENGKTNNTTSGSVEKEEDDQASYPIIILLIGEQILCWKKMHHLLLPLQPDACQ